ncbi:hypothetical protein RJT34_24749 [Clitoria ternatea]|uniref:Uncharacterized protein n=1 Tax=Clitoria ternatea TaxID=43366 RepID=A0AAN9FNG1_CLITE
MVPNIGLKEYLCLMSWVRLVLYSLPLSFLSLPFQVFKASCVTQQEGLGCLFLLPFVCITGISTDKRLGSEIRIHPTKAIERGDRDGDATTNDLCSIYSCGLPNLDEIVTDYQNCALC